jgi:RNA polymerase sigma-70 factor, ECF subfamily
VTDSVDAQQALQRMRGGEMVALAEIFGVFRPQLRRMVDLRMTGPLSARVDPSDVLQETYMDANHKIHDYLQNPRVSLFVWLRGLTLDRLAKVQRRHLGAQCRALGRELRLPEESSLALGRQLLAGTQTPSRIMERDELRRQVSDALQELNDRDREILVMRHFEVMTNSEVAEALDIGVSAATMRHGRALKRLKDMLSSRLSGGGSSA